MTALEVRGGPALPQERRLVTEIPGPRSRELTERRLAAVSNAVSTTMPVFAVAAGGGVVVDADGNALIDFGSGIAVTTIGNSAPQVVSAVQEQVERFTHTCFMITPYAGYVEVAEALNALTPGDHDKRTALFNSGAEAVENAVKIARLATGRSAVAAFDHAYHGRTNLTMALTAKALPYKLGSDRSRRRCTGCRRRTRSGTGSPASRRRRGRSSRSTSRSARTTSRPS